MLWNCNYRLYPKLGHFKNCLYSRWHFYTQANNNFAVFLPPVLGRLLSPEGKAKQCNDTHALASVAVMMKEEMCVCQIFGLSGLYEEDFSVEFEWVKLLHRPQKYFHYPFPSRLYSQLCLYYSEYWHIRCAKIFFKNQNEWVMNASLLCLSPNGNLPAHLVNYRYLPGPDTSNTNKTHWTQMS